MPSSPGTACIQWLVDSSPKVQPPCHNCRHLYMAIPASELPGRLAKVTVETVCITIQLLQHPGSLAPSQVLLRWLPSKLPKANLRFSTCFLRNSTCNMKLAKLLNFPICCTSLTWPSKALLGFSFPQWRPSARTKPGPSLVYVQNQ